MNDKGPVFGILGAFVVGVVVGGAIGILFAPAAGEETRSSLASTAADYMDDAKSKGKEWARRAQERVDDVKGRVQSIVEQ